MTTPQRWLLIPMQPTPNGRLHLGHGGGPYLRADVMARALRRDGHSAHVVTGSDSYENWVLADGLATGRSPQQTCAHYHAGLAADLANLGIQLDAWINPLDPHHREPYQQLHREQFAQLQALGRARQEIEPVPIGKHTGRAITGTFLAGLCPACHAPAGGNTCTACGTHFQPQEIRDPRSRLTDEPLTWTPQTHWFAYPPSTTAVLDALRDTGLDEPHLATAASYLDRTGGRVRLTQPGTWGIPHPDIPGGHVLANPYYTYSLYCAHTEAGSRNAFTPSSSTRVVGFFGTDNSIAGLVGPHVLAHPDLRKPFDHTVINYMLHYNGQKCSTSKRHGVWISELREATDITSDELRYFLAGLPLDHAVSDFTTQALTDTINELRHWKRHRLEPALQVAQTSARQPEPGDFAAIEGPLGRQRRHLTPPRVDLAAALASLTSWTHHRAVDLTDPEDARVWLTGVAVLAEPVMPRLAQDIHKVTGLAETGVAARLGAVMERLSSP